MNSRKAKAISLKIVARWATAHIFSGPADARHIAAFAMVMTQRNKNRALYSVVHALSYNDYIRK